MNSTERVKIISERLQNKFSPSQLDVIDDSEKHKGHEGAKGGAGHYTVIISADSLKTKSRIESHREIYEVLNDLIPHEVHALQIKIV
jgi:BolA protein